MSRACSAHSVAEKCSTGCCWWGYLKERDYVVDIGLDGVLKK